VKEYLITYQKKNGDIFVRTTNSIRIPLKGIGYRTNMGWTVIDIHRAFYDGNYYHEKDFNKLRRKYKEPTTKKIARILARKLSRYAQ